MGPSTTAEYGFEAFYCEPGIGGAHEKPRVAYCTSSARFVRSSDSGWTTRTTNLDKDGVPGEDGERLELLARLRDAFPYCFALALIERKERQARDGPGWDWPPGTTGSLHRPRPAPRVAAPRAPVCGITRPWRLIPRRGPDRTTHNTRPGYSPGDLQTRTRRGGPACYAFSGGP